MASALSGSSPGRLRARRGKPTRAKAAARVPPGPAAAQAAQAKASEVGRPDGIFGAAYRELPYPSRPAGQHVQEAVDVDDFDQLGSAEVVEQLRDVDHV